MRLRATGLAAWWVQRATAVFMLLFILVVMGSLLLQPVHSYAEWRVRIGHPAVTIGALAFFAALLAHMWVGVRDVLIDYARPAGLRLLLLCSTGAALLGVGAWVLWIFLRTQS